MPKTVHKTGKINFCLKNGPIFPILWEKYLFFLKNVIRSIEINIRDEKNMKKIIIMSRLVPLCPAYRVGSGCAMDYAGKYTVMLMFLVYRWCSSMLSYAPYLKTGIRGGSCNQSYWEVDI
jgi:hypothetical protein